MMKWLTCVFLCVFVVKCRAMSESEIEDFEMYLRETSQLDQNLKSNPEADYDEDQPVSDNAWEESGKFEGDLILNDRQRRMIVTNVVEGLARNGIADSTKRWPNNEVIYFIQKEHFNLDQVQAIEDGIADLGRASCVKFTPYKKGDRDAVVIQGSRRGCFSQVGYQGGYQVLNLSGRHPAGRGCFRHGTVVHELLHTLGFYHMQSSPDRDDYIDVLWENIIQATRHNFRKYNSFAVSDFGVGYDYESVLHYSRKAFSINGQDTLVPKQRGAEIGQRIGLSQKDTQKLNKMYCDADSDRFLDSDSSKTPIVSKKTDKNKPFEGRGIGYHQGKAVAINLPTAQTYNLHDLSNIHKFNDFSKAKESVPPMSIQGFGAVKKINVYASQNSFNEELYPRGKYESEDHEDSIFKFSDDINEEMDSTGARKLDYEPQGNTNYNMPRLMRHQDEYQPFVTRDDNIHNVPKIFVQESREEKNIEYENTKKVTNSLPSQYDLLQQMKQKYNGNRYDDENDHILQTHREGPFYNNDLQNYSIDKFRYDPDGARDAHVGTSQNYQALEDHLRSHPNVYNSKESQLPSPTKWLNSNKKYAHYGRVYLDDR